MLYVFIMLALSIILVYDVYMYSMGTLCSVLVGQKGVHLSTMVGKAPYYKIQSKGCPPKYNGWTPCD